VSPRRATPRLSSQWKPVFFISLLMLVVAIGLFMSAKDGSSQASAAGLFIAAAAMLFVAARNSKPR
jgi:hypothetical protein